MSDAIPIIGVLRPQVLVSLGISEEGAKGKTQGMVTADVVGLGKGTIESVAVLAVELSSEHTTETEKLAFAAVVDSTGILETRLRTGSIVMDAVIDCDFRHHPFTTGMIAGSG
jgi:hypothetical protein